MRAWNCYFADGQYPPGTSGGVDNQVGLYLLNWNAHTGYQPTCELIIDD